MIFHWFSGASDDLHRAIKLGCFFSVGPRMLASRRGREYARQIPVSQLLLETDMPARAGDKLPAEVWRAELDNALSGIAQLKGIDRRKPCGAHRLHKPRAANALESANEGRRPRV